MTKQPTLFPLAHELSRSSDPATSHQAAFDMVESGQLSRMAKVALEWLMKYNGHTAAELESISGLGDGKIRKRLNDLRKVGAARVGAARVCKVTGKAAQTWWSTCTSDIHK